MRIKHFWFVLTILTCINPLYADRFSEIAEAQNVLDRFQLGWSNKPFPIHLTLYGYVKGEGIIDSYQNFTLRSGQFLYFPLEKMPDVLGNDINSRGDFDEYAIQSHIDIMGTGPDIGCMQSKFFIEADFFGRTNETINVLEIIEAYLELTSEHFNFLAGQTYHPICFPYESPDTISYNVGVPTAPYAFCPQVQFLYHDDSCEVLCAAIGFLGDRPFGLAGGTDKAFRDAIMPDIYLQARIKQDEDNFIGAGFDVMRIIPRLETNKGYKEVNSIVPISADLFARFQYKDLVIYSKLIYAQDAGIFELLGGLAVHSVDPVTDIRTYTPLQTVAFYTEFIRQGNFEPGLYIGIVKNLGALQTIIPSIESQVSIYGIGINIDTVLRIAPRIRWYMGPFIVGIEYEYTRAAYGTPNTHGRIEDIIPSANNRFLFATYYVF